jgi:hypothetical protein
MQKICEKIWLFKKKKKSISISNSNLILNSIIFLDFEILNLKFWHHFFKKSYLSTDYTFLVNDR